MKRYIITAVAALALAGCVNELEPVLEFKSGSTEITLNEDFSVPLGTGLSFEIASNFAPLYAVSSQTWCTIGGVSSYDEKEGAYRLGEGGRLFLELDLADPYVLQQSQGVSYATVRVYCGNFTEKEITVNLPGERRGLEITGFSPSEAAAGSQVTLTGRFGTIAKGHKVTVNGVAAEPVWVSPDGTMLNIEVPPRAGTGKIKVSLGSDSAETQESLEYLPSYIGSPIYETREERYYIDRMAADSKGNVYAIEHHLDQYGRGDSYLVKISGGERTTIAQTQESIADYKLLEIDGNGNPCMLTIHRGQDFYSFDYCSLLRYNSSGGYETVWSGVMTHEGLTTFCMDGAGNAYILYAGIQKVTPEGVASEYYGSFDYPIDPVFGLTADSAGNLYMLSMANYGRMEAQKLTPSRELTPLFSFNALQEPYFLDVDGEGNVYYSKFNNNTTEPGNGVYRNNARIHPGDDEDGRVTAMTVDNAGNVYLARMSWYKGYQIVKLAWE